MNKSLRKAVVGLALLSILAIAGCSHNNVGTDGFPPPQPEPAAAKAAAMAAEARTGNAQQPPANNGQGQKNAQ